MSIATDGFCSGPVLTDSWVLTAARCFYSDQNKIVETKETVKVFSDIYNKIETEKHQERDVDRLEFPEGSVIQIYYGPALLKLDKPFILFDSKTRIEVIDVTHYGFGNAEDQNCKIESYGYSKWTVPTKGTKLKSVGNYIKTCKCSEGIKNACIYSLTNTWICGHSEFMFNLCKGDFGAGLICDGVIMGIFVGIIGLDSDTCTVTDLQSKECEKATNVNVFVDVCYHLHWIHALIPTMNLNSISCDQSDSAHFSEKLLSPPVQLVLRFVVLRCFTPIFLQTQRFNKNKHYQTKTKLFIEKNTQNLFLFLITRRHPKCECLRPLVLSRADVNERKISLEIVSISKF
ncbi:hypothetical protein J6590_061516 [Homalodisca vitripennis]|nr:hypothetical protein J6590_061516 [Homalodisca vitripennis]